MKQAILCGLALTLLCLTVAPADSAAEPEPTERTYRTQYLDTRIVEALFWQLCPAELGEQCQVPAAGGNEIRIRAPLAVHRQLARMLAERDVLPSSKRLQLYLFTAHRSEQSRLPAALGAGTRKALEDLAAVTAYRSFELLDTGMVETVKTARTNLTGPGGLLLDAELSIRTVTGLDSEKLLVDLRLSSPGGDQQPPAEGRPPFRPGTLLSTSLSLDAGETVVVGTSRLDGGEEALVLLLTALP